MAPSILSTASITAALLLSPASAFSALSRPQHNGKTLLRASLDDFKDELKATANAIAAPGKGILACDESTGTVGARLESIGLENTEDARKTWRGLLFSTPDLGKYVSGAILYEETLFQDHPSGKTHVEVLQDNGIIPGIKVDAGLKPLPGGLAGEQVCTGLDGLPERCDSYYARGARFAKWRTALKIQDGGPSALAVQEAAWGLARYARICQDSGLVPIVEPEILMDGDHDIETTAKVQEAVLAAVYKACSDNGVYLEGSLLKPSMTVPGVDCKDRATPEKVAEMTIQTLERTVPASVPGVTFLSGGLAEEDASIFLNTMNSGANAKGTRKGPWSLTFSFSRAMQSSCLKQYAGKPDNIPAAQACLAARAQANSEANLGSYVPGSQPSDQESLYVKDYVY